VNLLRVDPDPISRHNLPAAGVVSGLNHRVQAQEFNYAHGSPPDARRKVLVWREPCSVQSRQHLAKRYVRVR
jgi:hypothetical protein